MKLTTWSCLLNGVSCGWSVRHVHCTGRHIRLFIGILISLNLPNNWTVNIAFCGHKYFYLHYVCPLEFLKLWINTKYNWSRCPNYKSRHSEPAWETDSRKQWIIDRVWTFKVVAFVMYIAPNWAKFCKIVLVHEYDYVYRSPESQACIKSVCFFGR